MSVIQVPTARYVYLVQGWETNFSRPGTSGIPGTVQSTRYSRPGNSYGVLNGMVPGTLMDVTESKSRDEVMKN